MIFRLSIGEIWIVSIGGHEYDDDPHAFNRKQTTGR